MLQPGVKPRRVLMTCDAVGGIWRYTLDLVRALDAEGVETIVVGIGPRPEATAAIESPASALWLDHAPTWLAPDPEAIRELCAALAQLQHRHGADLVHVNQPAEAAFLDVPVPVVVAAHSCLTTWWQAVLGSEPPADWRWRADVEAQGFRRADAVLAPSASHAAAVRQAYGLDHVAVVSNSSSAPPGNRDRERFALAAGRWWDKGKNLGVLDDAAGRSALPVRIFGSLSGPDGTRTSVRHVRAEGQCGAADVYAAMRRAAVFVSPSLYEPFGLAALEAARSGAALVVSDIPTYREIWDGAALFFDPRSPEALAACLDTLARDPALREQLAAAAGENALHFTPAAQTEGLLAAYSATMARTPDAMAEPF